MRKRERTNQNIFDNTNGWLSPEVISKLKCINFLNKDERTKLCSRAFDGWYITSHVCAFLVNKEPSHGDNWDKESRIAANMLCREFGVPEIYKGLDQYKNYTMKDYGIDSKKPIILNSTINEAIRLFHCEDSINLNRKKSEVNGFVNSQKNKNGYNAGTAAAGITYGNISNASSMYFDDKLLSPRGHGFAAEHANHLWDVYHGNDAKIVGDDNAKNGADRIVNGINIQTKYCASGSKCVQECFENGKFRYWNPDGSPMQIEVPSDPEIYDSAIQAMKSRIERGEVTGISDPTEAEKIIHKGHFTYVQAKNIAKAGTVESICYDAASGAIIATHSFGITAVLSFATAVWNGEDMDVALKTAAAQGIKVGGVTFITAVLAGQLSKAGLNRALVESSEAIVKLIGPKASAVLANAGRGASSIYGGAAMKSAAKILRTNAITGLASFAVLSIGDVGNIFMGRISGQQLFKNMANTASTIAGGGAGWTAGMAAGAAIGSVIPGLGTVAGGVIGTIGGLLGAFGGGALASGVSNAVLDEFIEDDAERMVRIIQEVFTQLAEEYLVTQKEAERITDKFKDKLTGSLLKDMYSSDNRRSFARNLLESYFEQETAKREHIQLTTEQMKEGIRMYLESCADAAV